MARNFALFCGAVLCAVALSCCASPQRMSPAPDLWVKGALGLPHPKSLERADLAALFFEKGAPDRASLAKCDFDYGVERLLDHSLEDVFRAFPAEVKANPQKYHWCFYSKLLTVLEMMETDLYLDQKARKLADQYVFLAHLARVFQVDFNDSLYLRAAVDVYRRLNAQYFGRELQLSDDTRRELKTLGPDVEPGP